MSVCEPIAPVPLRTLVPAMYMSQHVTPMCIAQTLHTAPSALHTEWCLLLWPYTACPLHISTHIPFCPLTLCTACTMALALRWLHCIHMAHTLPEYAFAQPLCTMCICTHMLPYLFAYPLHIHSRSFAHHVHGLTVLLRSSHPMPTYMCTLHIA